ncbi:hypothetical protein [Paraburkholderia sp. BCC1886]|nr:hypothetical protein [Paraburkholderia sp. BCC1886]
MSRPTSKLIVVALTICVMCIAIGLYYFKWQGVNTLIGNDPAYPSAGGMR